MASPSYPLEKRRGIPLYIRILIGVALGTLVGMVARAREWDVSALREIGMLVITLLKALATPLILFAVLDAFLRTHIPARKGAKMVAIGLVNAFVAIVIGLGVANLMHGGNTWRGHIEPMKREIAQTASGKSKKDVEEDLERVEGLVDTLVAKGVLTKQEAKAKPPSLALKDNVIRYTPKNLVDPFRRNNVITVVLLAVLGGAALRKLKDASQNDRPELAAGIGSIEGVVRVLFQMFAQMLEWIVGLIPYAVFGIVASVVRETGPGVFAILGIFLFTMALGMFIHAFVYYSFLLRIVGGVSPVRFFRGASEAIVTALGVSSSLATLPVTLRCLKEKLHVSDDSARLAACVGTNLNHDGIILYEAAAVVFIAQAFAIPLDFHAQMIVALASVMAGIGIAGVPEAGLITLPLVLSAAGIPDSITVLVIPLILPVDWILGRCRAATNVISDMTVATLLDRLHPAPSEVTEMIPCEAVLETAQEA